MIFPQQPHIEAAWVLALLAHPQDSEAGSRKRTDTTEALLAWCGKLILGTHIMSRKVIPAALRAHPWARITRSGVLLNAVRRIGARLEAAAVAEAVLPTLYGGEPGGVLVDGTMRSVRTVEEAAQAVIDARQEWRRGEASVKSFLARTWTPTRPVLPLAIAFHRLLHAHPKYLVPDVPGLPKEARPGSVDFVALISNPEWVEPCLRAADACREILPEKWLVPLKPAMPAHYVSKFTQFRT